MAAPGVRFSPSRLRLDAMFSSQYVPYAIPWWSRRTNFFPLVDRFEPMARDLPILIMNPYPTLEYLCRTSTDKPLLQSLVTG